MGGSFSLPFPLASVSSSSLSTLLFLSSPSCSQASQHYQIHHPVASFLPFLSGFFSNIFATYLQQICKVRIFSTSPQRCNRRDVERCLVMSSLLSSPCLALAFTSTAKKRVQTKLTWQVTSVDNSKGQVPSVKQE